MQEKYRLEEILEVLSSETKLGILLSLQFYSSLNLKQIAKIAGIREPSAFEHIKGRSKKRDERGLLEIGLIEEDRSQKGRGKYYKLTELANYLFSSLQAGIKGEQKMNYFKNDITELMNFDNFGAIKNIINFFRNIAIISKNFATYTANFIEQQVSKGDKHIQDKLENQVYINFSHLNIKTNDHKKRLNDIFTQFGKAINEISEESKEISESEIDEKYFIYTFSTSLNLIDPRY
ncbi:MAG: winged helix-turn-helix transcriptional regulator [Candidatus Heimdallarchaeota archaeon]